MIGMADHSHAHKYDLNASEDELRETSRDRQDTARTGRTGRDKSSAPQQSSKEARSHRQSSKMRSPRYNGDISQRLDGSKEGGLDSRRESSKLKALCNSIKKSKKQILDLPPTPRLEDTVPKEQKELNIQDQYIKNIRYGITAIDMNLNLKRFLTK